MSNTAVIELNDVSIRYGSLVAVDRLTLNVRSGEIFGLLGPNGSGKSSTLAAIAGLLDPVGGSIRVMGLAKKDQSAAYAMRIGFVPQEPALYDELSAVASLDFIASLYGLNRRERRGRIDRVLDRVGLADRARDRVSTYSVGMQRRLNLAAALLHEPSVLLLDEPSAALDPASRDVLFRLLTELRDQGRTILFTTHQLEEAEQWCDRVGILQKGRLRAIGRPAEVLQSRARSSTVLGVLREEMAGQTEVSLRMHLATDVTLYVDGRHVKLTAPDGEQLALALVLLASAGAELESFRTPPARMDTPAHHETTSVTWADVGGTACSAS